MKLLFGLRGRRVDIFTDNSLTKELSDTTKVSSLNGQTIYLAPYTGAVTGLCAPPSVSTPYCHFANVNDKQMGCVLLENPRGQKLSVEEVYKQVC